MDRSLEANGAGDENRTRIASLEEPALTSNIHGVVQFSTLQPSQVFCGLQRVVNNQSSSSLGVKDAFRVVAEQVSNPVSKKSYAQVASSVTPPMTPNVSPARPHSAGRSPRPHERKSSRTRSLRLRAEELRIIEAKAQELRMSVNGYIRAMSLGHDYIEKPPEWLRGSLLQLYKELAGQGNNLNQLAKKVNMQLVTAESALSLIDRQREPVFRALERLQLALAGRRPPADY